MTSATTAGARTSAGPAVGALTVRLLMRLRRMPTILLPTIIMPGFFMLAFTGSFSGITSVEGFPTDNFVSWVAPFAIVQTASFAGVGASAAMANDIESGFIDRLLTSPIRRWTILAGALGQAVVRAVVPVVVVLLIAIPQGVTMPGGAAGVAMAFVGGLGTALMLASIGLAVVCRVGHIRALALVQVIGFLLLFPSNGQVPVALIEGWLHHVARFNPATNVIRMTRQGFIGDISWAETWPGLLVIGLTTVLFLRVGVQELARRSLGK